MALACSVGLHWVFFQSVAWMGMVVTYSQDSTLQEAVVKTFDGKHPCSLCKQIAKSKQSEKKSEFPLQLKKLEFVTAATRFMFAPALPSWRLKTTDEAFKYVPATPPTPPPRLALV